MEKLNILDVLLTYKNDSDKIAILGKALEMVLNYTDKIETALRTMDKNIHTIAAAITTLDGEIKRVNGELISLTKSVTLNFSRLEDTVDTVKDTVDTVKVTTTKPTPQVATPVSAPTSHRTSIVEESLMKPSQIAKSLEASPISTSPLGGGMSIRSAMMAEIKQRIGGGAQAGETGAAAQKTEIGEGYVPKIHQPRQAKAIEGGLVSKMNKLLDSKFQKTMGGGGAPSGPPTRHPGAPPRGPPSAGAPPRAPPIAPPSKKDDKKKKKEKKKGKKGKGKIDSQLSDLERKIKEKLG